MHAYTNHPTAESTRMRSTRVHRHINAPRAAVYRLLVDPAAMVKWKVPDGMTAQVHTFEAREGGVVRAKLAALAEADAATTRS